MSDFSASVGPGSSSQLLDGLKVRLSSVFDRASDAGRARHTALFAFAIRLVSAALAYASQIILARTIGIAEFGLYVYAWSFVLIIGHLAGLGLALAATRIVPQLQEAADAERLRGFLLACRVIAVVSASLVAAALILAILLVIPQLSGPTLAPLVLILFALPLFTLTEIQDGLARCFDAPALGLLPPYVVRPFLMLLTMCSAVAVGFPATAVTASICIVLITWLTGIGQAIWLSRRLQSKIAAGPRRYELSSWLAISLPLLASEGARIILQNSDVVILGLVASGAEIGAYFAVSKTMVLGAFVAFAINAAVSHRYAEYFAAKDMTKLKAFVAQSTRWMFWATLASVVLMILVGKPFLALFGSDFLAFYPLMFVLGAGLLIRAAIGPAERLLSALGDQASCARIYGVTLVVGLVLQGGCAVLFGASGLAWAVTLTLVLETILLARALVTRHAMPVGVWHRPQA